MASFVCCSASCIAIQIMFEIIIIISLSILKKHDMLICLEVETLLLTFQLDYLVIVRVAVL